MLSNVLEFELHLHNDSVYHLNVESWDFLTCYNISNYFHNFIIHLLGSFILHPQTILLYLGVVELFAKEGPPVSISTHISKKQLHLRVGPY